MNINTIAPIAVAVIVTACGGTVTSTTPPAAQDGGSLEASASDGGSGGFRSVGRLPGCTVGNNGARCES